MNQKSPPVRRHPTILSSTAKSVADNCADIFIESLRCKKGGTTARPFIRYCMKLQSIFIHLTVFHDDADGFRAVGTEIRTEPFSAGADHGEILKRIAINN